MNLLGDYKMGKNLYTRRMRLLTNGSYVFGSAVAVNGSGAGCAEDDCGFWRQPMADYVDGQRTDLFVSSARKTRLLTNGESVVSNRMSLSMTSADKRDIRRWLATCRSIRPSTQPYLVRRSSTQSWVWGFLLLWGSGQQRHRCSP
jgi:hypothetical protein